MEKDSTYTGQKDKRTLALIKPDAIQNTNEIEDMILKNSFTILQKRQVTLTAEQCSDFHTGSKHYGKLFPSLVAFMTSGPILAMMLKRENAIGAWQELIGPTNSTQARESYPDSRVLSDVRALFGTNEEKNAVHGSDSPVSVEREIRFFFPNSNPTRPVIIFGPFKETIYDRLMTDKPDKFAISVPHTTRPRRDNEINGQYYYFVPSREQMEEDIQNHLFIEAGEYKENFYGTSVQAVKVSESVIKYLRVAGLYSITIFIKPPDVKWIYDSMGADANKESAQKLYDKTAVETEQIFLDMFTAVVKENTLNDVYEKICQIIEEQQNID
ncbi:unnamed protein product [Didymodactylos carnosus]|uniref:Nucleoside diphosphate kinase n=1 Tax=Didymodactylos carnosus TaxID=1234261 RepID=A0A813RV26_9BILA|nr:unnamed protein product [Didymodactylos carnosus]CAF3570148.1 unnamed protein product [Didymodactylos carnosus]